MRVLVGTVVAAALVGCGGSSASVSNLRCDTSCQDTQDPFKMKLAVSYTDPDGVLPSGQLVVGVNGAEAARIDLSKLVDAKARAGTIRFPLEMHFRSLASDQEFTISVKAATTDGETGAVESGFILKT